MYDNFYAVFKKFLHIFYFQISTYKKKSPFGARDFIRNGINIVFILPVNSIEETKDQFLNYFDLIIFFGSQMNSYSTEIITIKNI